MRRIILFFGTVLLLAVSAFAQIEGGVADRNGKGVPEASITATDMAGKIVATVKSDNRGYYGFKGLQPGKYKIEVKAAGFPPAVYKNVVVKEGDTGAVEGEDDLYRGIRFDITLSIDRVPNQIEGNVADQNEKGLPNVTVTATDTSGRVVATVKSDDLGFYGFKSLRPGKYKIEAKAAGFRPAVYNNVTVNEREPGDDEDLSQRTWLYIILIPAKASN